MWQTAERTPFKIREVIKAQGIRVYTPPIEADDEPSAEQAKLLIVSPSFCGAEAREAHDSCTWLGLDALLHHRKHAGGLDGRW